MKRIILALAAVFVSLAAMAAEPTHVSVNLKSGESYRVSFDDQPEIAMTDNGISVSSTGANAVIFEFDEVESVNFTNSSAVETVAENTVGINVTPNSIDFYNVPDGSTLRLFNLGGQLVYSSPASGSASIVKSDYPRGVYVAVIGNKSFKVSF